MTECKLELLTLCCRLGGMQLGRYLKAISSANAGGKNEEDTWIYCLRHHYLFLTAATKAVLLWNRQKGKYQ